MSQHPDVLDEREEKDDIIDNQLTLEEMVSAINRSRPASPGEDRVCCVMLKHRGEGALLKPLQLRNRVWEEGRSPSAWKEAGVIPIRKAGKDPSKPTSYGPVTLTSNICKIMERTITERLSYELEKRGIHEIMVLGKEGPWTR